MIETQTYRGLWWLPSAPEDKHEGTLTVTRGDPRLDLLGHFGREIIGESDREIQYSMWLSDQERIVGVSTDVRYVTMVDCTQASGGGLRFPGIETSVYRARAVIEGAAFEDDEPIGFNDFEIRVSASETWLRFMPARFQVNEDGSRAAIDITHPQPLEFTLDDGTTATVRFSWRFGGFAVGSTKVEYEWAAWLGLKFNERRSLSDVATAAGWLRNLIIKWEAAKLPQHERLPRGAVLRSRLEHESVAKQDTRRTESAHLRRRDAETRANIGGHGGDRIRCRHRAQL